MSDPGTIVGLISPGIQACDGLAGYYLSWKNCQKDIRATVSLLNNLRESLNAAQKIADDGSSDSTRLDTGISSCSAAIRSLQDELEKFEPYDQTESLRNKLKTQARRLYYPFKESTLAKLREYVFEVKEVLDLAMSTLQLERLDVIIDSVESSKELLQSIQKRECTLSREDERPYRLSDVLDDKTREWLAAPDPTTNQIRAREKHHARTGSWFLHDSRFRHWEDEPNSFLWLQGFAGCGKTILSSTIIHHALQYKSIKANIAVVFFYFDFTDPLKQTAQGLFRAMISQLSEQTSRPPKVLLNLCQSYKNSTAPVQVLIEACKDLMDEFQEVFLVIDALDECRDRSKLLDGIKTIRRSPNDFLHLLATSRREEDLVAGLEPVDSEVISLQGNHIDDDIRKFIIECIKEDPQMQKWIKYHDEIEAALVDCQLSTLRSCRNVPMLRNALKSLPKTLDETYEIILRNIDHSDQPYALRILEFICFSARPLTIEEVNDALAIELDENPRFDPESRFLTAEGILYVCPSLLVVAERETREGFDYKRSRIVQLAHFSVKEYLVSARIAKSNVSYFALDPYRGNETLCRKCLTYLDYFGEYETLAYSNIGTFPLARYAAEYWPYHYKQSPFISSLTHLIINFFTAKETVFLTWLRLFDIEKEWFGPVFDREMPSGPYALYYASYLGLEEIVRQMLRSTNTTVNESVISNPSYGTWSTVLCGAIDQGHTSIVKLLLEHGADSQKRARAGKPLSIAVTSSRRKPEIIKMLIQAGAQVNHLNFQKMTALHLAAFINDDSTEMMELLLQSGADVSATDSDGRTALHRVCTHPGSQPQRTRLLLAAGSNPLHEDRHSQTALGYCAVKLLHQDLRNCESDWLLNYFFEFPQGPYPESLSKVLPARITSKVNSLEEFLILFESVMMKTTIASVFGAALLYGTFTREISFSKVTRERLVFQDLEKWLDRYNFNWALNIIISHKGQAAILEELLKNAPRLGNYNHGLERALVHSSLFGDPQLVLLLLQYGADPDYVVSSSISDRRSPLLVASNFGKIEIVRLLIEHGVDLEARDNDGDTAIHLASYKGHIEIVKLLAQRHKGCLVMKNKIREDCLLSAAGGGRTELVQWLLDQDDTMPRFEKVKAALVKAEESLKDERLRTTRNESVERLEQLIEYLSTIQISAKTQRGYRVDNPS